MSIISVLPMQPPTYATTGDLPLNASDGALAVVLTNPPTLYTFNGSSWSEITGGGGGGAVWGSITGTLSDQTDLQNALNAISSTAYQVNTFTLSPTDISNKYVTLSSAPTSPTLTALTVIDGPMQKYGTDFTITGSQLSWSTLGLDGILSSSDVLIVQFY